MADYDVITIGAGPTGLMTAAMLAKEGKKVLCLELTDHVGGIASNAHEFPGFIHNRGMWFFMFAKLQWLWDTLEMDKYGVELLDPPSVGVVLPSKVGQPALRLLNDPMAQFQHIAQTFGPEAADGFGRFMQFIGPFGTAIDMAMGNPPISIQQMMDSVPSAEARDAMKQIFFGNLQTLLDRYLPDKEKYGPIRGFIGVNAVDGFWGGPMTPGSSMTVAYHFGTPSKSGGGAQYKIIKGHIGRFFEALGEALVDNGGTLRLNSEVKRILVDKGKAYGVELANGEKITGTTIVSSCDTYNTFIRMVGSENTPPFLEEQIRNINYTDQFIQIYMAFKRMPKFREEYAELNGSECGWNIWNWPTSEALEKSWDAIKYGGIPDEPLSSLYFPSLLDPNLAPPGMHSGTCFVMLGWPKGVPEEKRDELKKILVERTFDTFERFMPDFRDCILDWKAWSPEDYEKVYHNTGGTWTHGMIQLDQMFDNRPVKGMANYRTPIENLYLCGTSNHPGPGVTGFSVTNCLKVMKEDWKKKNITFSGNGKEKVKAHA